MTSHNSTPRRSRPHVADPQVSQERDSSWLLD